MRVLPGARARARRGPGLGIRERDDERLAAFRSRARQAWRAARSAVAFGYYGLAGLALSYAVLPLQGALLRSRAALTGRPAETELAAQRSIHLATRSFVALARALRLIRVHFRGAEALRRGPVLVVANHPSLIDTPLLTVCMPQADFVVSAEWSRNPYLRHAIEAAGYLPAERGPAMVEEAVARLRAGRSVVLYPEGTRTPAEGLGAFGRSAAHIALRAGCDLLPVFIRVAPRILMKGQPWTHVPERMPEWHVEVGEPIRPCEHLDGSEPRPVAARRLTAILRDGFEKRWDHAAP